jgi:hypothetical protein
MCLRFVFLLITRVAAWLRLSRREEILGDRRDLDPAPPARRSATAAAAPPEPGLGRPGLPGPIPKARRGYRTLAAEFGLLDQGTPPERMADEAIPKLMAAVPESMRPAVVGLLNLGYGALGGAVYTAIPQHWRRHWASGPVYGMAL